MLQFSRRHLWNAPLKDIRGNQGTPYGSFKATAENEDVLGAVTFFRAKAKPHVGTLKEGRGAFTYDVRTEEKGGGIGSKADDSTDRLPGWDRDKREWVQKSQIFADVKYERPQGKRDDPSQIVPHSRLHDVVVVVLVTFWLPLSVSQVSILGAPNYLSPKQRFADTLTNQLSYSNHRY